MRNAKTIVAFLAGLAFSYFHWLGLLIGGGLIGLTSRSFKAALVLGFLLGVAVWVLFLIQLSLSDMIGKVLAMAPLPYLSLLLTLIATTLSSIITNFFSPSAVLEQ